MKKILTVGPVFLMVLTMSCISFPERQRVRYAPTIDLKQCEIVGIIEFTNANKGNLAPYITKRFMQDIRRDQGMVRIIELGTEKDVLKSVGHDKLGPEALKAIGQKYNVKTIIKGNLVVSDVQPDVSLFTGGSFANVSAKVMSTLACEMIESASGASIWSKSVSAVSKVGEVSVFGGKEFGFDAKDPDKAYGELMNALVIQATPEFKATYGWKEVK
ncbi:MAG: hypothetical protein PHX21_04925 [bacterium]|nr:hypothetical protein [bacterium]